MVRLGLDKPRRVFSVRRYGLGLSGLVSLWPKSRCQNVGCGWGRAAGRGLYPCLSRVLDLRAADVKAAGDSSCCTRASPGAPCSRSLSPSGTLTGVAAPGLQLPSAAKSRDLGRITANSDTI